MVSMIGKVPSFLNDSSQFFKAFRRSFRLPNLPTKQTFHPIETSFLARRLPRSTAIVNNFRGFLAIGQVVCQYEHPHPETGERADTTLHSAEKD
jgi:hypothetical protein